MAHEQFFYSQLIQDDQLLISGSEHQHLARVMRKTIDEIIWVSDGKGIAYKVKITEITKENTHCTIMEKHPNFGEPQNKVSLAVGLVKASHWEIMLEKAVELGVHEIYPLLTQHTQTKFLKRERSEKIILSAMKQSARSLLPILHDPVSLKVFLNKRLEQKIYICDNQDDYPMLMQGEPDKDYVILIGPEGGFSPEEIKLAKERSAEPVLLSNRRLRTETAALKALSILSQ